MRIFVSRHGQTDWNVKGLQQGVTDIPLNETGLAQARQLAQSLLDSGIKHVYTSELSRANVTGQTVADLLGIPCEVIPGIQEIGLGEWQGYTWAETVEKWPELSKKWTEEPLTTAPENGENYQHLIDRFVSTIHKIMRGPDEDVLVVSHGGCLHTIFCVMDDVPLKNMQNDSVIPNAKAVELDLEKFLRKWPLEK